MAAEGQVQTTTTTQSRAPKQKWWKYNFAGHEVLTQYILAVMEKPMPPSSMSYRHLVHRNSTKEVFFKKLPLRPRQNSNRRHFYRHLNWNFLKKIVLKPCFSEKLTWLTNYWRLCFNLLTQISWSDFNSQLDFWPKCISLHYYCPPLKYFTCQNIQKRSRKLQFVCLAHLISAKMEKHLKS